MKGLVPYASAALWAVWLLSLQGFVAARGASGAFVPDLGVVLVVSIAARSGVPRALGAALVVAIARASLSADPAAAIVLAHVAVAIGAARVAGALDLDRRWAAAVVCGLGAAVVAALAAFGAGARTGVAWQELVAGRVGPIAVASAAIAVLLGTRLRWLPGMRGLWQEDGRWVLAARAR